MAVRLGDIKVVRRNLKKKNVDSTPWEVYDLANDPGESTDLAQQRPDVIAAAVQVLRQQTSHNSVFPMPKPEI